MRPNEPPIYRVIWGFLGAIIGGFIAGFMALGHISVRAEGVTYADLAAIVLTAVTVILAVFGLILAGAAIYGFQAFMKYAETTAIRKVEAYLDENAAQIIRERADAYVNASSGKDDRMDYDTDLLAELYRQSEQKP